MIWMLVYLDKGRTTVVFWQDMNNSLHWLWLELCFSGEIILHLTQNAELSIAELQNSYIAVVKRLIYGSCCEVCASDWSDSKSLSMLCVCATLWYKWPVTGLNHRQVSIGGWAHTFLAENPADALKGSRPVCKWLLCKQWGVAFIAVKPRTIGQLLDGEHSALAQ